MSGRRIDLHGLELAATGSRLAMSGRRIDLHGLELAATGSRRPPDSSPVAANG